MASATSCKRYAKLNKLLPACLPVCLCIATASAPTLTSLSCAGCLAVLHNLCRFYATRGRPNHAHTNSAALPLSLSCDTISRHSTCGKWQPERTMPQRKLFECHKCLRFKGPLTLAPSLVPPSPSAWSASPPPPSNLLQFQVVSY